MIPVFPYLVRRTESGYGGELLLRLKDGRSAYVVQLPLEQARMLAVEMRGLATDHCQLHHLALRLAQSLGAEFIHVLIKNSDLPEEVLCELRLMTSSGFKDVEVDAAAALAMAVHLGLPIFMDGNFVSSDNPAQTPNPAQAPNRDYATETSQVPKAFRQLLEDMHMSDAEGGLPI